MKRAIIAALTLTVLGAATYFLISRNPALRHGDTHPDASARGSLPPHTGPTSTTRSIAARVDREKSDFKKQWMEIARMGDAALQRKKMAALLRKWMAEDEKGLADHIAGLRDDEAKLLLPLLATSFVDECAMVPDRLFFTMAKAYAHLDLNAATQWSGKIIALDRDVFPCVEMFGNLAKQNAGQAMAFALEIPQNGTRRFVMEHIAANAGFSDPRAAHLMASQLPAAEQGYFYTEFYREWALRDPETARQAIHAIENPSGMEAAARGMAEALAGQPDGNMNKILQWADSLPTAQTRGMAVYAIYQTWSTREPYEAVKDAANRYPDNPDIAQGMFANAITGRNDEMVWELAQKLESPIRVHAMLGSIGKFLETEPTSEVVTKVTQMPTGEAKDACAEFLALQPRISKSLALSLAGSINSPEIRTRTLNQLK